MVRCQEIQSRMAPLHEAVENREGLLYRCLQREAANRQFADTKQSISKAAHQVQGLKQRFTKQSE